MQKVVIDEKVTIWQRVTFTFDDDIDLSNKDLIMQAIENSDYYDMGLLDTYHETENHIEYDKDSIELL